MHNSMNPLEADSQHAQSFGHVCSLLLQSEQYTCVQDAETFSRLLCVSKQLRSLLLHTAVGCLLAEVPRYHSSARTERSMVQWLVRHVRTGNIRALHVEADDFFPDLYIVLAGQLQETAAAAGNARQQQHHTALSPGHSAVDPWPACTNAAAGWTQQPEGLLETLAASSKPQSAAAAGPQALTLSCAQHTRQPHVTISWHVCGLPPSSLPYIPGATLTHLTLRDSNLSPNTLQELTRLKTLQHLHLPNLNPDLSSSPRTLSALTALRQLFIRHPSPAEQHSLPVSLQQLTVAQSTPPWVDATPSLQPLTLTHLTALTSLTVHEWFPNGISQNCRLPSSLQHLCVVCVTTAAPLLPLKRLRCVQLSSLRHSLPQELLLLSSLSNLSELRVGTEEPGAPVRLCYDDIVAYGRVFEAVPVVMHTLKVLPQQQQQQQQQQPQEHPPQQQQQPVRLCKAAVAAISCLRGLTSLTVEGAAVGKHIQAHAAAAAAAAAEAAAAGAHHPGRYMRGLEGFVTHGVTPIELAEALGCLTGLTQLSLCKLQLAAGRATSAATAAAAGGEALFPSKGADEACQDNNPQVCASHGASSSSSSSSSSSQHIHVQSEAGSSDPCSGDDACSSDSTSSRHQEAGAAGTCLTAVDCTTSPATAAAAGPADWSPALQLIATHPSLQRLVLTGMPLGVAAAELAAALQLQSLELHSCSVPAGVVAELLATLGCSSPQDHMGLSHDSVTGSISHPGRSLSHAGAVDLVGRYYGGGSLVPLAGVACPTRGGARQRCTGSLTSLIFTQH